MTKFFRTATILWNIMEVTHAISHSNVNSVRKDLGIIHPCCGTRKRVMQSLTNINSNKMQENVELNVYVNQEVQLVPEHWHPLQKPPIFQTPTIHCQLF